MTGVAETTLASAGMCWREQRSKLLSHFCKPANHHVANEEDLEVKRDIHKPNYKVLHSKEILETMQASTIRELL